MTVVVNDGSEYGLPDGVRVIVASENLGFAKAVNLAVESVLGAQYVVLINPDVTASARDVECLVEFLDDRAGIAMAVPVLQAPDDSLDYRAYENWTFTLGRKFAAVVAYLYLTYGRGEMLGRWMKAPGAFLAFTPETVCDELGRPFREAFFMYGEDRDLTNRVRGRGLGIGVCRSVKITHVGGASGVSKARLVERAKGDAYLRVAYHRYGRVGALIGAIDLLCLAFGDALRGRRWSATRSAARRWAIRRWVRAGLRSPQRPDEAELEKPG